MQKSRLMEWVRLCEHWCEPEWVHWCDGSLSDGEYVARLAKTSPSPMVNAPNVPCVTPDEAIRRIAANCRGVLHGQTMFIVPNLLAGDDAGVLVTNDPAAVTPLYRQGQVGAEALAVIHSGEEWVAHLYLRAIGDASHAEESLQSIRCHLFGPSPAETACRPPALHGRRQNLPMETWSASCGSCARLCSNRARALASVSAETAPAKRICI